MYVSDTIMETRDPTPALWYHYVDDTHTKLDAGQGQAFTDCLNSLDPDIRCTIEGKEDGVLSFQNTNTVRKPGSSLNIIIYVK